MILQALAEYYEALQRQGKAAAPGWGPVKVSFALYLNGDGALERAVSVQTQQPRGKKTVIAPQIMLLPAPVKRTVGVAANFLCDNSGYILGADDSGKPQRTAKCFQACKALHEEVLAGVDTPAARAVLAFFRSWSPECAPEHPALAEHWEEIRSGANLVFRYDGGFVHDDPAVRRAWERYYSGAGDGGGPEMVCLVTGDKGPVENIHPAIKGVQGAQSSGAALVSFNAPAFCSYGKEQNFNAPTSRAAAFAYTTALNYLISDREHVFRMGDATVVCWARGGEDAYQSFFSAMLGGQATYSEADLQRMTGELCKGHEVLFDETRLDPNMDFYVLGLSPNAARLSVRFFLRNTFQGFLQNNEDHRQRLRIARPAYEKFEVPSLKMLLDATVNQNTRDKQASPQLAGEMLRAVLTGAPYPATLLGGVTLRIRAEQKITWPRAAILKAYFLKNYKNSDLYPILQEVARVDLNETCTYQPYVLGRLFAVMEKIQLASADWSLNRTIKDSYFNSAAVTPKNIFARLFPLSGYHMKKLSRDKPGLARTLGDEKRTLLLMLTQSIPARFTPEETNCFYIGYYHQNYQKKEEKQNA